jgi:cytochrome P450
MSATTTNRLPEGIDLANPDSYVDALPLDWFQRLREEAPVVWHPEPAPNHGFWAVTRYDDLTAVHMDWSTYSSEVGAVALEELDTEQLEIRKSMLETDPPRHTALRKICSKRFSARGVGVFEDWIREVAQSVLDHALAADEPFDFVAEISRELPIRFLCSIFTVPQDDAPQLISWGDNMIANQDPELSAAVVDRVDTEAYRLLPFRSPTALDVFAYADRQRDDRLVEPSDDVIQALVTAQSEGMLDEREYHNYFSLLMIAGNETTRHTISSGMLALLDNPEQMRLLTEEPDRIGVAVEEILRWATPVLHFRRTATRDTELRGQTIREGDKVVTWYISANHDPEMFTDPDRFDVTRTPNEHVTFGPGGPHFCLGAHLARLETKILFQEMLPRLASMEIVGDVERIRSNFVNGIKRMPVRITIR